jgi:hypothetical protein
MLGLRHFADESRPRSLLRAIGSLVPVVPWVVLYLSARGADEGVGILTVAVFAGVSLNEAQITRLFAFSDAPRSDGPGRWLTSASAQRRRWLGLIAPLFGLGLSIVMALDAWWLGHAWMLGGASVSALTFVGLMVRGVRRARRVQAELRLDADGIHAHPWGGRLRWEQIEAVLPREKHHRWRLRLRLNRQAPPADDPPRDVTDVMELDGRDVGLDADALLAVMTQLNPECVVETWVIGQGESIVLPIRGALIEAEHVATAQPELSEYEALRQRVRDQIGGL